MLGLHEGATPVSLPSITITIGNYANQQTTVDFITPYQRISYATPDLLDCEIYRAFWITWSDGNIKMGTISGEIFSATDPAGARVLRSLHLGNAQDETTGNNIQWVFRRHAGV